MVSTSVWHGGDPGSTPGHGRHGIFVVKPCSQHWGPCIPRESENHINVGPVSIWDKLDDKHPGIEHPPSVSIERSSRRKCS